MKAARFELTAVIDPAKQDLKPIFDRFIASVFDSYEALLGLTIFVPTASLPIWIMKLVRNWLTRKIEVLVVRSRLSGAEAEGARKELQGIMEFLQTMSAIQGFVNACFRVLWVPVLCFCYIQFIYPNLPQSVGGARPMAVTLIVAREDVPTGSAFAGWMPAEATAPAETGQTKTSDEKAPALSIPVTLYLRTEDQLFVRKGKGPVVSFSEHAILGIVFDKPRVTN